MTPVFDSIRLASGAPWASDAGIRVAFGIIRLSYPQKSSQQLENASKLEDASYPLKKSFITARYQ